jgi:hypothetical protein
MELVEKAFWLRGAFAPFFEIHLTYLNLSKKLKQKCFEHIPRPMCIRSRFKKNWFSMWPNVKMKKIWYQNQPFRDVLFVLFYRARKMSILNETLREYLECGHLHAKKNSNFFNIFKFKIYFLDKGSIYT